MTTHALTLRREPSAIPGFGLAFGVTLTALCLIVLIPLAALILRAAGVGVADFWHIATTERTLAALELSFGAALVAAIIDTIFGLLLAWVLVRYRFPGRSVVNGLIDLPVALPTAVAGISLTAIYAPNGVIGALFEPLGIKIAYTPIGIVLALVFIGLPFVVRTVQPVIEEFEKEAEEAAALLGASRLRTVFTVVLPAAVPALLTGFALAFARAVGEYGSVIFIAGNLPGVSEIAPLLIVIRLEEFDYTGATVIAAIMLAAAFVFLLAINLLQARSRARLGYA
jgi:sulfate/thiosulfate transport system permease protein